MSARDACEASWPEGWGGFLLGIGLGGLLLTAMLLLLTMAFAIARDVWRDW